MAKTKVARTSAGKPASSKKPTSAPKEKAKASAPKDKARPGGAKPKASAPKDKARPSGAKPKASVPKPTVDLASVLAKARELSDAREWTDAGKLLNGVCDLVPKGSDVATWERVYELTHILNIREAQKAAKGIYDAEPKAPANVRALRLVTLATAEEQVKGSEGYKTFQSALKLATDDETRAKVLLAWGSATHDQVTPLVAMLDARELALAGKTSTETSRAVWDLLAVGQTLATSQKSIKAQEKLFAARGISDGHSLKLESAQRWLDVTPVTEERTVAMVSILSDGLIDLGKVDEGLALFDKWTPTFVTMNKDGTLPDGDIASWFEGCARWLRSNDRAKDSARVEAALKKLRGY